MNDRALRRALRIAAPLCGLAALCAAASAQVRLAPVELPVSAPAFLAPTASPPGSASLSAALSPSLSAAPSLLTAPAASLPSALMPAAAAGPEAPAPSAAAPAAAPEAGSLWNGGMPASAAQRQLRAAHWETTKFFFTSRVKLLREMIEQQKAEARGKETAVEDLEKMWLDWRVQGYSGRVTTAGFGVADRDSIRKDALKFFDRHWGRDAASRAAFRRYMDRVDATVPLARPSNYRKHAFAAPFDLAGLSHAELPARLDSLLTGEHSAEIARHRGESQAAILASFKAAALASIREVNASLPEGKKVVATILLGSYSIGQSTPKSDIDYQLMTQDGSSDALKPFSEALDRNWTENRLEKIEAFQFALPPSREVVLESFKEGYQVISPDPAAVKALSKESFAPDPATSWSRLRGKAFAAFYRAWCWTAFRLADFASALAMSGK